MLVTGVLAREFLLVIGVRDFIYFSNICTGTTGSCLFSELRYTRQTLGTWPAAGGNFWGFWFWGEVLL